MPNSVNPWSHKSSLKSNTWASTTEWESAVHIWKNCARKQWFSTILQGFFMNQWTVLSSYGWSRRISSGAAGSFAEGMGNLCIIPMHEQRYFFTKKTNKLKQNPRCEVIPSFSHFFLRQIHPQFFYPFLSSFCLQTFYFFPGGLQFRHPGLTNYHTMNDRGFIHQHLEVYFGIPTVRMFQLFEAA